jgi:hypothetical protein
MSFAPEQAKGVPLLSLRRYLILHGWRHADDIRKGYDLFALRDASVGTLEFVLPQSESHPDARRRVADALRILIQYEDREPALVVSDVRAVGIDVWRSVVPDALVTYEAVRLDIAQRFVFNAKELLAAAATTEASPKPYFSRVTKNGMNYARECRFGHTFRGSFGFTIESPVAENLSPTMPGVEEHAPLERRIMQRIARGINDIAQAGKAGDPALIFDNYKTGFSANMCDDFVELMDVVGGQSLGFEFSFSPEWRPAADVVSKAKVELAPVHVELVKDASRRLRLREFDRNRVVTGRVVRLETEVDPSDLFEAGEREIGIQWNTDEFGSIRVRVTLSPGEYQTAVDAHGKGRTVSVKGLLDKVGRYWYLREPTDFSVLG